MIGALPFFNNASASAREGEGLTYSAQATLNAAYLWRGLYVGAANLQASASVGYGGLYADLWWNIGTTDWRFNISL